MAQKRYKQKKTRLITSRKRPRHQKRHPTDALEGKILAYLHSADCPASMTDVARGLTGKRTLGDELKAAFTRLLQDKAITKSDKKHFTLSPAAPLYSGTLQQHSRGFGFVSITGKSPKAPEIKKDIHISAKNLSGAMHGDAVLVYLQGNQGGNRPEGAVVSVVERGPDTVAGFYKIEKSGVYVYPEDNRYPFIIKVNQSNTGEIESGAAVIAQIHPSGTPTRVIRGTIVEVLGSPDNIDVQMRLVIEKFRLPHTFSEEAIQEASNLPETIPNDSEREDLRDILHVTIDGETAKDFDDAICVKKIDGGYRLYVSIADVSHFVKPGSPIDKDAYQRGTSIYFPGRVIPMLPEKLSNNLCSLIPEVDRLAVTAILDFDDAAKRTNMRFCRSIIKSHNRFTYTTVRKILIDNDEEELKNHSPFLPMLNVAEELARALMKFRKNRGSINFTLPEPEISLDQDGRISTISRAERNFAHHLIEEFMLAANEAVAETFTKNRRNSLYRIHELPDYAKVTEFSTFAKTLDLQLPPAQISAEWFGQVLDVCNDSPKAYIVNNLLLRTMQQARYSPDNVGHFALAAENYTHFTSPIRRYPDLMVHRELCQLLVERSKKPLTNKLPQDLTDQGSFLSARERVAVSSEREMGDRLKMLYMEKHLGESFSAIISGVTDFAFFVELLDLFISGAVPIELLGDDYYLYDGKHHRLIGEISGTTYQIGDIITVTTKEVDKNKNRINFVPTSLQ